MRLNIITPEGTLVDQEVDRVELPGAKGRFVVLKGHAPIISSLVEGDIVFGEESGPSAPLRDRHENSVEQRLVSGVEPPLRDREGQIRIKSGFVEVADNQVIACVETR
ncbi:MAG: F0F1 ATP synthase subunit epsilon [Bacteroidales bacterium]|nr:F0F1 ATP synthase subunit epsilon [Bacteroidales bacterium]